jgi:leucyl aminopeptidase (aminopeptidase T)
MGAASVHSFTLPGVRRPARPLTVVPDRLLRLIRESDVIISLLTDLDLTVEVPALRAAVSAFREARRGRWAFGAYIDQDILVNELTADYREVARVARNLAARLAGVDQVRLRTAAGTDLTLRLGRRPVHIDTGILTEPGDFGNLPAGEVFVAPLEESAEGRLVVDLSLGDLVLAEPVTLTFQAGRVISVAGGQVAERLRDRLGADPWAWTLGEFGMGANPHARIRGRVTTDEKVLGTAHIALGANTSFGGCNPAATHYDCVIGAPQIYLDRQLLGL